MNATLSAIPAHDARDAHRTRSPIGRGLSISVAAHAVLVLAAVLAAHDDAALPPAPPVYRVSLVAAPATSSMRTAGAPAAAPPASSTRDPAEPAPAAPAPAARPPAPRAPETPAPATAPHAATARTSLAHAPLPNATASRPTLLHADPAHASTAHVPVAHSATPAVHATAAPPRTPAPHPLAHPAPAVASTGTKSATTPSAAREKANGAPSTTAHAATAHAAPTHAAPTHAAPTHAAPTHAAPTHPAAARGGPEHAPSAEREVRGAGTGAATARGRDVADVRVVGLEFPFPGYLANLVRQVRLRFEPTDARAGLHADLAFVVARDGSISSLRVVRTSGNYAFDLEAQGAVEAAGSAHAFGPLPDAFRPSALPVTFSFDPKSTP